jgi:intracellular septation protein A
VDLLGGLALFGIVMLLISAGFSWLFDSELAVQLKSTCLGLLVAAFFAVDGWRGGTYLGQRLSLYLAYNDIDPQRLAWSFAGVGLVMALLNALVALSFSKDVWLWYTLWGDLVIAMGLGLWAINRARGSVRAAA